MWTRLLHLNIEKATKHVKVGKYWLAPALSRRYQAMLAKEFRKAGLPNILKAPRDDSKNARHTKPKGNEYEMYERALRQQKILANLTRVDEDVLKYRQEMLNKRPYKGFDRLLKEALPEWIIMLREESAENVQRPKVDEE